MSAAQGGKHASSSLPFGDSFAEQEAQVAATTALLGWLQKPDTHRSVVALRYEPSTRRWLVALSVEGRVVRSDTQQSFAGAVRNAMQAAAGL